MSYALLYTISKSWWPLSCSPCPWPFHLVRQSWTLIKQPLFPFTLIEPAFLCLSVLSTLKLSTRQHSVITWAKHRAMKRDVEDDRSECQREQTLRIVADQNDVGFLNKPQPFEGCLYLLFSYSILCIDTFQCILGHLGWGLGWTWHAIYEIVYVLLVVIF